MRKLLTYFLATVAGTLALQAQKPALDHSVYDGWKSLGKASVPWDGAWMSYTLSPQQGDGVLYLVNAVNGTEWSCPPRDGAQGLRRRHKGRVQDQALV